MEKVKDWHKSSYSYSAQNCVEVREHTSGIDIRDTQNRDAGHLSIPAAEWTAFLADVRHGRL